MLSTGEELIMGQTQMGRSLLKGVMDRWEEEESLRDAKWTSTGKMSQNCLHQLGCFCPIGMLEVPTPQGVQSQCGRVWLLMAPWLGSEPFLYNSPSAVGTLTKDLPPMGCTDLSPHTLH